MSLRSSPTAGFAMGIPRFNKQSSASPSPVRGAASRPSLTATGQPSQQQQGAPSVPGFPSDLEARQPQKPRVRSPLRQLPAGAVIHRSKRGILVSEPETAEEARVRAGERAVRGWNSPQDKAYRPLGELVDIYGTAKEIKGVVRDKLEPFVEEMKRRAPVGKQKEAEHFIKPVPLPPHFLQEKNAEQIIRGAPSLKIKSILNGPRQGSLSGLAQSRAPVDRRVSVEDFLESHQLGRTGLTDRRHPEKQEDPAAEHEHEHEQQDGLQDAEDDALERTKPVLNQVILLPALERVTHLPDGSRLLRREVQESKLRLDAARHGKQLREISPAFQEAYFLPDKTYYYKHHIPAAQAQAQTHSEQQSRSPSLAAAGTLLPSLEAQPKQRLGRHVKSVSTTHCPDTSTAQTFHGGSRRASVGGGTQSTTTQLPGGAGAGAGLARQRSGDS